MSPQPSKKTTPGGPAPAGPFAGNDEVMPIYAVVPPSSRVGASARATLVAIWTAAAFFMSAAAAAAEPLEVVRVRIPASQVAGWFPPGTALRLMGIGPFNSLLEAARRADGGRGAAGPRLIRARHHARWRAEHLEGRSELVVETGRPVPAFLRLEPWTPFIPASIREGATVVADGSGKSLVELPPGDAGAASPRTVTLRLDWALSALPETQGRRFKLGLPGDDTTVLTLEAPADWIPFGLQGFRQGPLPSTAKGSRTWQFHGRVGSADLQLEQSPRPGSVDGPLVWVEGPTRIDLGARAGSGGKSGNWQTDWSVQLDPRGVNQLVADLDPGLELIGVSGPEVKGFQTRQEQGTTRVVVSFSSSTMAATAVRFEGHVPIPDEGSWRVPAVRPVNAVWTGGTTALLLSDSRPVRGCTERAGRRVLAGPTEPGSRDRMVFEAHAPESVADLVFGRPQARNACVVRGLLFLGSAAPRLQCQITGLNGASSSLEIDLPATWVPDRVQWGGMEESLAWHATVGVDGATRLNLLLPEAEATSETRPLIIGATSTVAGGRGPLVLPRVRPAHAPIADELWTAIVEKTMTVSPLSARGLAWLDHDRLNETGFPGPGPTPDQRPALAWRWNAEIAEARIAREQAGQDPRLEVRYVTRISSSGDGLEVDGRILVKPGNEPVLALPLWVSQDRAERKAWSFREVTGDQELSLRPLDPPDRARLGFPETGTAWVLALPDRPGRETTLRFRFRGPWTSRGSIPVLTAPKRFLPRGTLLIEVPHGFRSLVQPAGPRRLDLSVAERLAAAWEQENGRGEPGAWAAQPRQPAHGFTYTDSGTLTLETLRLEPSRQEGVIRDSCLTTILSPEGPTVNRFRLLVDREEHQSLEFRMPSGASLVRARIDGKDVEPVVEAGLIRLGPPAPGTGQRQKTVDIDYVVEGLSSSPGTLLRPVLPQVAMPCLSFCWELIVPPYWRAGEHGPGLEHNDTIPAGNWPLGALGIPPASWAVRTHPRPYPSEDQVRRFDEALRADSSEELSLAALFARWDSGATAVLVDRPALSSLGYGPRSRCVVMTQDPTKPPSSLRLLEQYGLALMPVDGSLVVTSRSESTREDDSDLSRPAVGEALLWGADRSDRFQTVPRWRGEETPREALSGEAAETLRVLPGWSVLRYTAVSWPDAAAHVRLVDERSGIVPGWMVVVVILAGLGPWLGARTRLAILISISLSCVAVLVHLWCPAGFESLSAGLFLGSLPILLYRLGGLANWKSGAERPVTRSSSHLLARPLRSSLRPMSILIAALFAIPDRAGAIHQGELPIPVLIPYEGKFDPELAPTRAILRQSDFERLRNLARPAVPPAQPPVVLLSATHRVSGRGDREALVESELTLRNAGSSAAAWDVPIAGAREITASIDGRPAAIFLDSSGRRAAIEIPASAIVKLRVRRTISVVQDGQTDLVDFPVNPVPSAGLIVDRTSLPMVSANARGVMDALDDTAAAGLGPTERVQLRLRDPRLSGSPPVAGGLETIALWDIVPAGDYLRSRFTYRGSRGPSTLRFRLEPGLIPRKVVIPGLIDHSWSGKPGEPIWTARVDAPLADGAQIIFEAWRPFKPGSGPAAGGTGEQTATDRDRRCPLLEPVELERHNGLLGIRRPGHWTGRLEADPEAEPLGDEVFVRTWGPLPDDALTLAGTTRLDFARLPTMTTGPAATRIRARPMTQLRIEPGRIDLVFDNEFTELSGPLDHLEVEIPRGLNILAVESDGLTNWSLAGEHTLLLRYDRIFAGPKRRLKLSGWLPVSADPLDPGAQTRRLPTPWPHVLGADGDPGRLVVTSIGKVDAPELTLESSGPITVPATRDTPVRQAFRVDDPSKLGELRWNDPLPRLNVMIENQLTLHPDSAEWVAVLNYDISGGSLDSIHLKLPTAWAARAQVELGDDQLRPKIEVRGASTLWNFASVRPIWGIRRLVLRSTMPLVLGQEIAHPEITPLGHGLADTYLGVVNATGSVLKNTGMSGLHATTYAGHFQADEFSRVPGADLWAFRVERDNWSLRVQLPPSADPGDDARESSARVVSADVTITETADGKRMGRAVYEVQPRTGPFLVTELPKGGTLIWSTLENQPVGPLRSAEGRWLVPLGDQTATRVCLFWSEPPPQGSGETPWSLRLPRTGMGRMSTLVTLRLPDEIAIRPSLGGLELSVPDRMELERADRIARQIGEILGRLGRGPVLDRDRIVPLLIAHEMTLRSAERSLRRNARRGEATRRERAERDLQVIQSTRKSLIETLRVSGLDEEIARAQATVGGPPAPADATAAVFPEQAASGLVRSFGRPSYLIGLSAGLDEEATVILGSLERATPEEETPERARSVLMLGFLAALLVAAVPRPRRGRRAAFMLTGILGLVGFVAGPIIFAAASALSFIGWWSRSSPRSGGEALSLGRSQMTR
jgi:hypothetical protein